MATTGDPGTFYIDADAVANNRGLPATVVAGTAANLTILAQDGAGGFFVYGPDNPFNTTTIDTTPVPTSTPPVAYSFTPAPTAAEAQASGASASAYNDQAEQYAGVTVPGSVATADVPSGPTGLLLDLFPGGTIFDEERAATGSWSIETQALVMPDTTDRFRLSFNASITDSGAPTTWTIELRVNDVSLSPITRRSVLVSNNTAPASLDIARIFQHPGLAPKRLQLRATHDQLSDRTLTLTNQQWALSFVGT